MSTGRLEAFSDGVIAVAITLLVLDISVPGERRGLGHNLLHQWPHYAAYVVSFITIGIIWINHHVMVGRLRQADRTILGLNLLLLLTIGVLPFATALMAEYVNKGGEAAKLAAAVYSGAFLVMSIAFSVMNRHILLTKPDLHDAPLPLEQRRRILLRSISGLLPYAVATGLAFVSPYATLVICGALALFYALPISAG
jgi:uncharacterized membrane protein